MNIGSILWPSDEKQACFLYLGFALEVVEDSGIQFPGVLPDPVAVAKGYIAGTVAIAEYGASAEAWWSYLETVGGIREFENRDALTARLAICLLGARTEEASRLGEHLSWLLEVLHMAGCDTARALQKMATYFPRKPN